MQTITATELARNLRQILDRIMISHEEFVIERNHREIARMLPGPGRQTALEAMADLYRTLPEGAAAGWVNDSRNTGSPETVDEELRDPWAS